MLLYSKYFFFFVVVVIVLEARHDGVPDVSSVPVSYDEARVIFIFASYTFTIFLERVNKPILKNFSSFKEIKEIIRSD